MSATFAIVAPGGMGSALAERLIGNGATVVTSLVGRSETSRMRAEQSGMVDVGDAGLAQADIILSVVPPDQALPLAERLALVLAKSAQRPVYVDCNATGPELSGRIGAVLAAHGIAFVDAGIIGMPPRADAPGPTIFLSGPHARQASILSDFGVATRVMAGDNGAASALKMAYAGLTKGLIALAATMAAAAVKGGVADDLVAELARSQPQLLASFARSVPDMLAKAQRWVPEMHEIAGFVGDELPSAAAYTAFAGLYDQIAGDEALRDTLAVIYKVPDPVSQG